MVRLPADRLTAGKVFVTTGGTRLTSGSGDAAVPVAGVIVPTSILVVVSYTSTVPPGAGPPGTPATAAVMVTTCPKYGAPATVPVVVVATCPIVNVTVAAAGR